MKPDRIVKRSEIQELTGLSLATVRRLEAVGEFPRRRLLAARAVGWRQSEIVQWLKTRERVASATAADSRPLDGAADDGGRANR
jgi:prophage regulatory protein